MRLAPITIPIRTVSEANQREHWAAKAGRAKKHRTMAWACMREVQMPKVVGRIVVHLTRIAPRKLDDDNLRGALKATRDGIADWLEIDDGSDLVRWEYSQERGKAREYAVRVTIRTAEDAMTAARMA